jgi:hypothetical protein
MGLYEFHDKVFLDYKGHWFVWESAWDQFRPIESIVWTGTNFHIHDEAYCSDPTDSLYGYGSDSMRELCTLLHGFHEGTPVKVTTLPMGTEWFRDRFVSLSPCAPRDASSWKRMVQGKGRTCRKAPRGKKFTRRSLNKTK